MNKRNIKDLLYEQVARIGKATSSPKRLELLELLAQSEKSVEALADELSIEIKLASAHLKVLREARLVDARKDGKYVFYRLAGPDVASLWVTLREVAEEHLLELRATLDAMANAPDKLASVNRTELMAQAKRGDVIVIDVRPRAEFDQAHLPYARSMPMDEIAQRIAELPKGVEIVAYCRGPFCLFSEEAASLLKAKGRKVSKLLDGVSEWKVAGMPLEIGKVLAQ
jgi:DNA-binding transcriptional ArsR family regulator/rhodanese-related sulfurtransferase